MLRNCDECNRVFAHPNRRLCQECYDQAQKAFTAVKEYLLQNPNASVADVSGETGVDVQVIYDYIRDGRLSVVPRDAQVHCVICNESISSGRVCAKCRTSLKKADYQAPEAQEQAKSNQTRVHYLDQVRGRK